MLFIPPFAEEMNRTRRLMSCIAYAIAHHGIASLVYDLPGTGESATPFSEARWDQWLSATVAVGHALSSMGYALHLVGFRLGALLGREACIRGLDIEAATWIAPVTDGRAHLRYWLRVKSISSLEIGPQRTLSDLETMLTQGQPVDFAGYPLTPALAQDLASLRWPSPDQEAMSHITVSVSSSLDEASSSTTKRHIAAAAPWLQAEPEEPVELAQAIISLILEKR